MTPDEFVDPMRAAVDQEIALAPEMARWARGLFLAFKAKGFNDVQALQLARDRIQHISNNAGEE